MCAKEQLPDRRPPRPQIPTLFWLVLAFLLGAALMYARMSRLFAQQEQLKGSGWQTIEAEATADARFSAFGTTGDVIVRAGTLKGMKLELRYAADCQALELGQRGVFSGLVRPLPADTKNLYRLSRQLAGTLSVTRIKRRTWGSSPLARLRRYRAQVTRAIAGLDQATQGGAGSDADQAAKGLICGISFGDLRLLSNTKLNEDFQRTGLSHLLSVSGSHLAVLAGIVYLILGQVGLSRKKIFVVTLLLAALYLVFTGMAPGALRSFGMLLVSALAFFWKRRVDVLQSLSLTAAVLLLSDPLLAVSLSFLFSVVSVVGIVLFTTYVRLWFDTLLPRRLGRRFSNSLALSCVAAVATLPFSAGVFGRFSLIAPLANLLVAPLISVILLGGLVVSVSYCVSPALAFAGARVLLYPSRLCADLAALLARPSWASFALQGFGAFALGIFILALFLLWLIWPRPTKVRARVLVAALAVLLALCSAAPLLSSRIPEGTKELVVLDVGQGDALLLRDGQRTALIDTGPSARRLKELLQAFKVRRIDTLIFTHDHADHASGAAAIDTSFGVRQILVSEGAQSSPVLQQVAERLGVALTGMRAGQSLKLEYLELRALWPTAPVHDPGANESCLTTLIVDTAPDAQDAVADDTVLCSGDAEAASINAALSGVSPIPKVDVLKVAHHGSKLSVDENLLSRIRPHRALISCGAKNSYGHPRPEALALLKRFVSEIRRTDLEGSLVIAL